MENPYRWQYDRPEHIVFRPALVDGMARHLRDGRAVKLVGGRGMGKSVLLRQLNEIFTQEPGTRVALVPGPAADTSIPAYIYDLADRLHLTNLARASMDLLMEALDSQGVNRLVVLLDEIDQYVLADSQGNLARRWLNHLETLRKQWIDRFSIAVAGGLGLLHVSHVLGSGLVSRAESCISRPFDLEDLRELAVPLARRGLAVDESAIQTLAALSGGNPALATYGLAAMWDAGETTPALLQAVFEEFPTRHRDFVTAVEDGVSHHGLVGAPGRVLRLVRRCAGAVPQAELRDACAGDTPAVDVAQALQLLEAAGLVLVHGRAISDPVHVHPVASVLNMPALTGDEPVDPVEKVLDAIAATLGAMHRFGRDFHGSKDLLEEQVFSSLLAVSLFLLGWRSEREPIQAAGFVDLRVRLHHDGTDGHIVLETKIWPRNHRDIQQQIDDYCVSDTLHGVAVMIGDIKDVDGWAKSYEAECLHSAAFTRLPPPPDVVARWRVERIDAKGIPRHTDHFLVQIPKRKRKV